MREDPPSEMGVTLERTGGVVRGLGASSDFVAYASIPAIGPQALIEAEVEGARSRGRELSWNVYAHDRPAGVSELLRSAGFVPDEQESLMLFDLSRGPPL